jgi:hypothetical protein
MTTCVDAASGEGCFSVWGLVLLLSLLLCCCCCCLLFWLCARRRRREKKGERTSIIDLIWHHRMLTQKDLGEDLGATSNLADVSAAEVKVEIHMDHMNEERSRPMPPPMDEDIMEVKDIAMKQVRLSTQMVSRAYSEADVSAAEVKVEIHMDHMNEERSRPMPPPMDEDIMEVKDIAIKQVRLSTQMVSRAYSEKIHRQQIEMMTDDEEGVLSEDEPA